MKSWEDSIAASLLGLLRVQYAQPHRHNRDPGNALYAELCSRLDRLVLLMQ